MSGIDAKAIKPCPFCGGTGELMRGPPGCNWVECKSCGVQTNDVAEDRARELWNARPLPQRPAEAVSGDHGELAVAHAYVVDGECEQIEWGTEGMLDDPALMLLYPDTVIRSLQAELVEWQREEAAFNAARNRPSFAEYEAKRLAAEQRIAELEGALEPFAKIADDASVYTNFGSDITNTPDGYTACGLNIPVAHFRRARAVKERG